MATFGDAEDGRISKTELTLYAYGKMADGRVDFDSPKSTVRIQDDAIAGLTAFLKNTVEKTGRYRLIDASLPAAEILRALEGSDVDLAALVALLGDEIDVVELTAALTESASGLRAAEAAVIDARRTLITSLSELAQQPGTTETDMQRQMNGQHWLFGGRYVGVAERKSLAFRDQFDIPLVTTSGALHIVELKGPNIPRLIRNHRGSYIVGNEVHEAVGQTMNYLRDLDEQSLIIEGSLRKDGLQANDSRRVFATVVISHPCHIEETQEMVERTLRTYNAHLSRIEVVTYESLFGAARNALEFDETDVNTNAE